MACIVVVNVMSTDLMPRVLYREYYVPYLLKTVPLIPLWIVMQLELHGLIQNRGSSELIEAGEDDVSIVDPISHGG